MDDESIKFRLVNLPADQPLRLTSELDPAVMDVDEAELHRLVMQRPILQAAEEAVSMRAQAVRIAKGDRLPTVAAVSVDVESGRALKGLVAGGTPVTARLMTRLDTGWYRSKLPEVRIPGATEPDRFVLVGGHYCALRIYEKAQDGRLKPTPKGLTFNVRMLPALLEAMRGVLAESKEASKQAALDFTNKAN